jgi:hypothetical protein
MDVLLLPKEQPHGIALTHLEESSMISGSSKSSKLAWLIDDSCILLNYFQASRAKVARFDNDLSHWFLFFEVLQTINVFFRRVCHWGNETRTLG